MSEKTFQQPLSKAIVAIANHANNGKTSILQELSELLLKSKEGDHYICYHGFARKGEKPRKPKFLKNAPIKKQKDKHPNVRQDFILILKICGKWIAIITIGDPNAKVVGWLKKWLEDLDTKFETYSKVEKPEKSEKITIHPFNFLFCAARIESKLKDNPHKDIEDFAKEKMIPVIWTSTYALSRANSFYEKDTSDKSLQIGLEKWAETCQQELNDLLGEFELRGATLTDEKKCDRLNELKAKHLKDIGAALGVCSKLTQLLPTQNPHAEIIS
jgi:hypothetical protein